jgi:hypothetical protein
MKLKFLIRSIAATLLIGACAIANANTTYNVNLSNGTDTLIGSIITNGTLGQLQAGDFLGFSFTDTMNGSVVFDISSNNPAGYTVGCTTGRPFGFGCGFLAVKENGSYPAALAFDNAPSSVTTFDSGGSTVTVKSGLWSFLKNGDKGPREEIFAASPETSPYLIVATVPEPQTYVMFLSGLCIMGLIARRRRKS